MAEAIMKNDVKKEGLQRQIQAGSASIENWLNGKKAHPQVLKVLEEHQVPPPGFSKPAAKEKRWLSLQLYYLYGPPSPSKS